MAETTNTTAVIEGDIALQAKEKREFLFDFYEKMMKGGDILSVEDIDIVMESLKLAQLDIKEREKRKIIEREAELLKQKMEDSPFFLPDFNEKDESAKNLLFMIDTSGSMSDDAITECYSEIYGAIQQFNGKLQGKLGFFDAVVVEPTPFEDEEEFKIIRPKGGGGTSFHVIFDYVKEQMRDEPPVSIIILTDGYAPFPNIEDTQDIPVLWIINNDEVDPPWGKVARLLE